MGKQALLALLGGASTTLAFAPFDLWIFALITPGLLYLLLNNQSVKKAAGLGWLFGLGFFGSGVSWVYVSIHTYGNTSAIPAALLTFAFCAALALLFLIQAWCYQKYFSQRYTALSFSIIWLLFEWLRSWLFTGFPWLYLGYAATDTPLSPLASIGGIWLLSLVVVAFSVSFAKYLHSRNKQYCLISVAILSSALVISYTLPSNWTVLSGDPIKISIVQPNIPQETKWKSDQLAQILDKYYKITRPLLGDSVIIWPETAIPSLYDNIDPYFSPLIDQQIQAGGSLISGVPMKVTDPEHLLGRRIHNSILNLTNKTSYHKQRLVPFGEYIPWQNEFRDLFNFLNIPDFTFSVPKENPQSLMSVGKYHYSTAICYEIAYPELVRQYSKTADLILTLSNDTWFSHSIGPDQHFQIARMRAIENGRWLVRSSNNGISAIVNPQGEVVKVAERYTQAVLTGEVLPMQGLTPYQRLGQWPFIGSYLLILMGLGWRNTSYRKLFCKSADS
ncbi:MAG: apolipoprotein N-acyltransferase [Oceanospirillaceae bacterium]